MEKKQKARISVEVIYKSDNIFSEVIKNNKKIVLTAPKKNLFWKMSASILEEMLDGASINFAPSRVWDAPPRVLDVPPRVWFGLFGVVWIAFG